MTRYECVDSQKAEGFPVTAACKAAGVSSSGYYEWKQRQQRPPTDAEVAEADLVEVMIEIFDESNGSYGVPRMCRELRRRGHAINRKRVRRLMRRHGMAGRVWRRRVRTTIGDHADRSRLRVCLVTSRTSSAPCAVRWDASSTSRHDVAR